MALLDGGAEAYPRMLEAIDSATRRVHLEVHAFEREGVGSRFVSALTAAAHRGVEVKVIVDGWGSIGASRALATTLRAAGIKVRIHNPLTPGPGLRTGPRAGGEARGGGAPAAGGPR